MRLFRFLAALVVSATVGCRSDPVSVCPANTLNSVTLLVLDSATGHPPVTATSVQLIGSTGKDSIANDPQQRYFLGSEPGDFTVTVNAATYAPWAKSVHVDADKCGVAETVVLTALLQPKT